MITATHTDSARRDRYLTSGEWSHSTIDSALAEYAHHHPDRLAVVDGDRQVSYAELDAMIRRLAGVLLERGIRPGDSVVWQLPNWLEAIVVHHGALRIGAVSTPIIPIYRHREVQFILKQSRARIAFVPGMFRTFDHRGMFDELAPTLPDLEHVITVRGSDNEFDHLLSGATPLDNPVEHASTDVALLLYTSGTTSDPKGALHTHESLDYENRSIIELFDLTGEDIVYMPSPVGHITGILYGLQLPFILGSHVVFQDIWDPGAGLELLQRRRCTFVIGATPFLHGLVHHPDRAEYDIALRVFGCGGADVPPELIRQAEEQLGCTATRIYGSTEFPTLSGGNASDPLDKRATTDGRPIGSAEARTVDEHDTPVPPGAVGDLQVRGPDLFTGYLDSRLNADAFASDGWFRTGDLAVIDEDGYIQITGRRKDIIVRGGENISAKEIEDLLFEYPGIADIAVIGMPDPIMVERICAYVVPSDQAHPPALDELTSFLREHRMATQKLPERLEVVEQLPRTATGKIQKFVLRDRIRVALTSDNAV
ncbi:AMP-binding protein [Rhodococcus opacus]|uniref:AMP-binding protein n=1 Tax=Rhodococcus opacus TaxID=37919 RepID=UPI001B316336|nr:AMP-binding protein [Rhodococcus opacus]UZG55224.1 AMP-binding protein [Rhodococcus opacus]